MNPGLIERVRDIIGSVGPTQAAQAERLGMTPDKLCKSLNGTRRFNSLELALLAEAAGTTVDWLLSGREPRAALNVAARKNNDADSTQADAREILARYENIIDSLQRLGYPLPAPAALPTATTTSPHPGEQGEALAQAALEALGESPRSWSTIRFAAECERVFDVQIAATDLPDGLDGVAWAPQDFRLIIVTQTPTWTRQRFTLAHELGHILARDAEDDAVAEHVSPGKSRSFNEVRANAFAAALLMPRDEVAADARGDIDFYGIGKLAWGYQVSPSAMATRLKALGLIDSDHYKDAMGVTTRHAAQAAGGLEDHLKRANQARRGWVSRRLGHLAMEAYLRGDMSIRPLASLWEVDPHTLLDILEPPPTPQNDPAASETELVFTP